ncbi:MAG TPA: chromosome segregation protein SMC [Clostridiales bacterium]|nr:chromosome segregation protein SMC [Clostridiales bacterium]
MYLKEIIINGFKSFPEKTVVKINSELTAVVGPNGSGKSNISDSFKWVMGEQSAKILRGSKMEDVIFAGTEKRKPLSYAEVDLIFNNSSGKLPVEYSEVSIKRRLYRSGDSEYLLNNNSVRLKEIRELFMDTGIGIDGYSIIGQGRIEDIISSKSDIRRKVIEEAAGIVKFKTRKDESLKKLQKTEENILRINDIISEIEQRIDPLRKQKEDAEIYLRLKNNLKSYELNLFSREYEKTTELLNTLDNHLKSKLEELAKNNQRLEINKLEFEQIIDELKDIEDKKNNLDEIQDQINSEYLEKDSSIKLEESRLNLYIGEKEKLEHGMDEKEKQKSELLKKSESLMDQIAIKDGELRLKHQQMGNSEQKLKDYLADNTQLQDLIDKKKNDVFEKYNQQTDLKGRINTIDSLIANSMNRINNLKSEIDDQKNQLEILAQKIESLTTELKSKELKVQENNDRIVGLRDNYSKKNESCILLEKNLQKEQNHINEKTSKMEFLIRMQNSYDGYYKSVQNLMLASKNNRMLGDEIIGVVAELIETHEKYENALEVALGSSMQNILIQNERKASDIIDYLKSNNIGRVTFLPLDTIKPRNLNDTEKNALQIDGCIGTLNNLVSYDEKYSHIVDFLLGRVLLSDNIRNGIKIAKSIHYSTRVVTLEGEVINAGGSITGGSLKKNSFKLLSRNREIKELEDLIIMKRKDFGQLNRQLESSKDELKKTGQTVQSFIDENTSIYNSIINHKTSIRYEKEEQIQIIANINKLSENIAYLEKERENYQNEQKESEDLLKQLKYNISSLEKELEENHTDYKSAQDYLEQIKLEITECRIEISGITNDLNLIKKDLENNSETLKKNDSIILEEKTVLEGLNAKIQEMIKSNEILKSDNIILKETIDDNKKKIHDLNEERKLKQDLSYEKQKHVNNINKDINDIQLEINSINLKIESSASKIETLSDSLWDEYEMNFAMIKAYKDETISLTRLNTEVRDLKRKLKSLGDVNINAIAEYSDVSQRYEFLTKQRDDLNDAKVKLNRIIKELTYKMRTQFEEEYQKIRENFKVVFISLFNGGKADIVLTDEDDALNSEIEIYAQPPGKNLNKISLLSGGEKALTAIALLFAILRTKPTPFCILDEIEAALDDANVHRFAKYLKEFSKETQFLVITHRKGTMEYVDTLYGATMEEEGVTKLVSLKLSDYNN